MGNGGIPLGGDAAVTACVLLFLAVFSWPFLGAFDLPVTLLGVPSFLSGIFLFWGALVYALVVASRRSKE
ncbi:MAG: hypothetical protein OHK0028_03900 [Deltaproteobacteria bacterium]